MLLDKQLLVSDAQAVTVTAVSTNMIDTGGSNPLRDIGAGEETRMIVTTGQTVAAAGAATVSFDIIQADDAAGTVNVESLGTYGPFAKNSAQLTANNSTPAVDVVMPRNTRRFVGVRYNVATGPLTAGNFTAGLVHDTDRQRYYASGYPNAY